jgi:hypothetical protein
MFVRDDCRSSLGVVGYFGPQGGLTAMSGVPVCRLLIIALPGGPVLPPMVSSLPAVA